VIAACSECNGEGFTLAGFTDDGLTLYKPCPRCDGSRTMTADLADAPVLERPHVDAEPQTTSPLPSAITNPDAAESS
jgi:hypothetical protein